jgi:hypothetical protein
MNTDLNEAELSVDDLALVAGGARNIDNPVSRLSWMLSTPPSKPRQLHRKTFTALTRLWARPRSSEHARDCRRSNGYDALN